MKIIVIDGIIGIHSDGDDIRAGLAAANGEPVRFDISSPGGFVFAGLEMFNLIRDYPGHTEVRIMGLAASMASYIALAADKITAHDNAVFMIHNALTVVIGNHNDMRTEADRIERLSNMLAKAYSNQTRKPLAEIRAMMDAETFLFGDEMLHAGFVDELVESDPQSSDDGHDKAQAIAVAHETFSACIATMQKSETANSDLQRAAALMNPVAANIDIDKIHGIDEIAYSLGTSFDPEAPFPNEHACRVREPSEFQKGSFKRISRKAEGKTLDISIGRLKGKNTTTTQAFRYPKEEWNAAQARKHCEDHDGSFEPATAEKPSAVADKGTQKANQKTPVPVAGKNKPRREKIMTLAEFLKDNPTASFELTEQLKAELAKGRDEGRKEAEAQIKTRTDVAGPIIASAAYPPEMKALAIQVLEGGMSPDAFKGTIAVYDASAEGKKNALLAKEQVADTPANDVGGSGQIHDKESADALIAKDRAALGKGVKS
ncbi:Clp protease ClpP [Candidatus Pacearchaeota archaeon]|nr:Clp protease ClpP [Candidatus Pacearchaeota archaeon]